MVNGSFRNLVRPVLASGSSIQTTQLAASRTTNLPKSQKKSCC